MRYDHEDFNNGWPFRISKDAVPPEALTLRQIDEKGIETITHVDPVGTDRWLREMIEEEWAERLYIAMQITAAELSTRPGPVELVVQGSLWFTFPEFQITRPATLTTPLVVKVVPPHCLELLLRKPSGIIAPSTDELRRAKRRLSLVFDRAELVTPAEPTSWDFELYVAQRVREHYSSILRFWQRRLKIVY